MTEYVILAIKQLLDAAIAAATTQPIKGIQIVYYGDPVVIAQSNMPCLCIIPGSAQAAPRGSRYDNRTGEVKIKLVFSVKDDIWGANQDIIGWTQKAVQIIEKMDGQKYHAESIMGILRANQGLPYNGNDTVQTTQAVNVEYRFENQRGWPTFEATITVQYLAVWDR